MLFENGREGSGLKLNVVLQSHTTSHGELSPQISSLGLAEKNPSKGLGPVLPGLFAGERRSQGEMELPAIAKLCQNDRKNIFGNSNLTNELNLRTPNSKRGSPEVLVPQSAPLVQTGWQKKIPLKILPLILQR